MFGWSGWSVLQKEVELGHRVSGIRHRSQAGEMEWMTERNMEQCFIEGGRGRGDIPPSWSSPPPDL